MLNIYTVFLPEDDLLQAYLDNNTVLSTYPSLADVLMS
jgi:hypothetical protein